MSREVWGDPPDREPVCCPNCGSPTCTPGCEVCAMASENVALRNALRTLAAEAEHFKFVVIKPQIYTDKSTATRVPSYLAAIEQAEKVLAGSAPAAGVTPSPEGFGKLDLTVPDTGEVRRARSVRVPDSSGNGGVQENGNG